jgi:hypothetical protein
MKCLAGKKEIIKPKLLKSLVGEEGLEPSKS